VVAGTPRGPGWLGAAALAVAGAAIGAVTAFLADPKRGRARRARLADQGGAIVRRIGRRTERAIRTAGAQAQGAMAAVAAAREPSTGALDDVTLRDRAQTELFRDQSVPKGSINLNAERGTLVLRGEVPTVEMRDRLGREAEQVDGVWSVRNLLTVAGEEQSPVAAEGVSSSARR
jgi:osmotically-inducible protein OsmY